MAHGKIRVNTLSYDTGSGDVDIAVSSIPDAAAMNAKADLASPTLTGTPAAPTAASGTNTTQIATTAFVTAAIPDISGKADTSDIGTTIQAFDADTAKTDVNQTFTAAQRGSITTDSSSAGVLEINFNDSNNFEVTLSHNITTVNVAGGGAGQSGSIFINQAASGTVYTVGGWDSAFKFSGGVAPTITATNAKTDRIDYVIKAASGGTATDIQVVWTGNY